MSVTGFWNVFLSEINYSNTIFNILHKFLVWRFYFLAELVCFKDALKAFGDFKNKNKSVWGNVFWYTKVYIFWKFIQYSIHWEEIQTLQKIPLAGKISVRTNPLCFLRASIHHSFVFLIHDSCMSCITMFASLKACVKFSIFDTVSYLLKCTFCSEKSTDPLTLQRHNSFQN